jgi:hypothetical protein
MFAGMFLARVSGNDWYAFGIGRRSFLHFWQLLIQYIFVIVAMVGDGWYIFSRKCYGKSYSDHDYLEHCDDTGGIIFSYFIFDGWQFFVEGNFAFKTISTRMMICINVLC